MKPPRAIDLGIASCHTCGLASPAAAGNCPRCATALHLRKPHSLQRTLAFLFAATALYVPANILPIMVVTEFGDVLASTILEGVAIFWKKGDYPIATVIFVASVLIPVLKIIALFWLCAAASGKVHPSPAALSRVYWITELVGRWSMVDVFVVAVMVALVQLGALMTITPGPAAVAFGGVVVSTMIAAMSFDPRLLWDQLDRGGRPATPTPP